MIEVGYVYCKGKWTLCETVRHYGPNFHNYRIVKVMTRCCFEHEIYSRLLVQPTLWSKYIPKYEGHPLLVTQVMVEVLAPRYPVESYLKAAE